jgi:hypothetical protein
MNDTDYQAFLNTWNWFKSLKTSDSPRFPFFKLHYYRPGSTFTDNPTDQKTLRDSGTGNCFAWVQFLENVARLSNSEFMRIRVEPITGYNAFLVNNWIDRRNQLLTNKWRLVFQGDNPDMVANNPNSSLTFGGVTNDTTGVPGQNSFVDSSHDCPSQKVFGRHYLLLLFYDGLYYDPSYGVTYEDEEEFKSVALYALARRPDVFMKPVGLGGGTKVKKLYFELDKPNGPWVKPWPRPPQA